MIKQTNNQNIKSHFLSIVMRVGEHANYSTLYCEIVHIFIVFPV